MLAVDAVSSAVDRRVVDFSGRARWNDNSVGTASNGPLRHEWEEALCLDDDATMHLYAINRGR